ncbi:hypothetical protein AgCh_031633 [Apium graveolens]
MLPGSMYEVKKTLIDLGLKYVKIHACPNDCVLYRGPAAESLSECPQCHLSRWKIGKDSKVRVNVPAKVMWYFPIIPRFKRLFKTAAIGKLMSWHAENRSKDGKMRHPSDSPAWQNVDSVKQRTNPSWTEPKWGQFKTDVTRKFVLPFIGDKKKLNKPPKRYAFVSKSTWKNFVKQRTDPSWMGIHEAQSERVSQRKYHHRLSRKGYIGLKEDGESCSRKKNPIEQFFGKNLGSGKMAKRSKRSMKTWLLYAKKFREHSGRVRALGGYATPKQYFKLPREKKIQITKKELLARDRERDEKVDKKTQALEAEIAELKEMMASGFCSSLPNHGQRSCELSVNTIDNKVALGMVYPGKDKEKVHGIDIPLGNKCVSVDGLLKPDVLLPVTVRGEMVTARDALGSFLAWPEGLINYTTPAIKKKERKRPGTKPGLDLNNLKSDFLEAKPSEKVPKGFNLLYKPSAKVPKEVLDMRKTGSPKQPGGTEYAYVVMRYMKEIINGARLTFTTKWLQKTRMCYTEEQLDEVRVEALGYIQEHT